MSGYASRKKPSEGKVHDLYAKALVLDLIGFSRSLAEPVAQGVRKRTGLGRDRLILTSSHTHTGPVIRDSLITMYDLNAQQAEVVSQYSAKLAKQLVSLAAAKISYGAGQPDFVSKPAGALSRGNQVWRAPRRPSGSQRPGVADRR